MPIDISSGKLTLAPAHLAGDHPATKRALPGRCAATLRPLMFSKLKALNVTFVARDKLSYDIWPKPVLASDQKPEWYSQMVPYIGGKLSIVNTNASGNSSLNPTMKQCMPVLDLLGAGYHILLPCDVYIDIDQKTGEKKVLWADSLPAMITGHNPAQVSGFPIPEGYDPVPYKWNNIWIVKTPPGWSCVFQHPAWHDHLPFRSLAGLVDTDEHDVPVELPFLLKRSFTGLIPRGTPMIQVLPFKRADTRAEYTWDKDGSYKVKYHSFFLTLINKYKKFVRQPKPYSIAEEKAPQCPFAGTASKD